jgi:hypothetical protein
MRKLTEFFKIYYVTVDVIKSRLSVNALRRAIAEVKQRWSVIGWMTKNLLSRAPKCFKRHVKPLVPAAFAVVSTYQTWYGGLCPVLLMCNP